MTTLAITLDAADGPRAATAGLRRLPVTCATLVVLLLTGVLTGALPAGPSSALVHAVGAGVDRPVWGLLTSALWCAGPVHYLFTMAAVVVVLVPAERRLGSRVSLILLLTGQAAAGVIGLAMIGLLARAGDPWAQQLSTTGAVGVLPGLLAVAGLVSARSSTLWRRRLQLSLPVVLLALVLYSGTVGDVLNLAGWLLGSAVGLWRRSGRGGVRPARPGRREARALVALVVAATALGPLIAALSQAAGGPWGVVSHLFVAGRPGAGVLRAVCAPGGDPGDCAVLQARARLTGYGPAILSVLPVLLQLLLADGLRRGRRAAWLAAVAFDAALSVIGGAVSLTVLRTPTEALPLLDARPGSLPAVSLLAPFVAPLAVLVLLLLTRSRFGVRAAPGSVRRWAFAASTGLGVVVVGYVGVGWLLRSQFTAAPSALALLGDLPGRMLPPGYLGEVLPALVPLHGGARLLGDWAGIAAWVVILVTAIRLVRPAAPVGDAAQARGLVDRWGAGPLSFMATWAGNRYWFTPDGTSLVAYRVIGGVAVTTGDPIGPPERCKAAVVDFTAWCAEHDWTPCWYSVTGDVADTAAGSGAQRLQVASEAWLPLGGRLAFTGRRWQDVRTAMNRARRENITAQWITWSAAPLALRDQVARLSEEWLSGKGLPEMGFTLGGLDELADDAIRVLLAVDAGGRVLAVTSWLPAHRDHAPVGWTLDMMRRSGDATPGIVEFLIATAALAFQEQGAEWVSLSGAPLALPPGTADQTRLARLLELAGKAMEPVYGFRSLLAFKTKFQPEYRPLWLLYPATADLPRIARAVSRAYLPHLSLPQAGRLAAALVRGRRAARPHLVGGACLEPSPAPRVDLALTLH